MQFDDQNLNVIDKKFLILFSGMNVKPVVISNIVTKVKEQKEKLEQRVETDKGLIENGSAPLPVPFRKE